MTAARLWAKVRSLAAQTLAQRETPMINHYSGNLLHAAHRQDLVNEAKGSWLLKQTREAGPAAGRRNLIQRVWLIVTIAIALALGVLTH
jgi:hypothetical protein